MIVVSALSQRKRVEKERDFDNSLSIQLHLPYNQHIRGVLCNTIVAVKALNPICLDIFRFQVKTIPQIKRQRQGVPTLHLLKVNRVKKFAVASWKVIKVSALSMSLRDGDGERERERERVTIIQIK